MKLRKWLAAGLVAAVLGPAAPARAGERPTLAQIQALVSGYKQKSSGPLASFAGVYDLLKTCRPLEVQDGLMATVWLQGKWVVWFEGDELVFVQFLAPANVVRGTLKFKRDYAAPDGRTVKFYDVTWKGGDTEVVAFLPDRELFDVKFEGNDFTAAYTLRCRNEDQMLGWAGEAVQAMGP